MASKADIILRTKKIINGHHVLKHIAKIPSDQVCVLYLGGNLTLDDSAASGNAKIVEQEILGHIHADVPVYAVRYKFDDDDVEFAREYNYDIHGQNFVSSSRMRSFVSVSENNLNNVFRRKFLPRVTDDDGSKLNFAVAAKRLSEFYIAISGDFKDTQKKLQDKFVTEMKKIGYANQQIELLLLRINQNTIAARTLEFKYIDDIFNRAILPRISDENGGRLDTNVAMRRIRQMNIVAHCHGGYVAQKLEEKTQLKMRELGYSRTEINRILSQMLVLAHAPTAALGKTHARFISFTSVYDFVIARPKNWIRKYIDYKKFQEAEGAINTDWASIGVISGQGSDVFFTRNTFEFDARGGPLYEEHSGAHYIPFINQTKDGKTLAKIAGNVLTNGIKNSLQSEHKFKPLPPIEKLILGQGINNEWLRTDFETMKQNGRNFMKNVYEYATANMREIHPQSHAKNNNSMVR